MNRGGPTRNDGGRYSTPRGRGRGRGRSPSRSAGSSSAHHNGPAGPVGPSSNVSSGNKYQGSHYEWRPRVPVGSIPKELDSSTSKSPCRENCSFLDTKDDVSSDLGSIPKQLDSISTSKCPCRENCSFPDTKDDVSSDLGKLKPGENSPEAVTPKTEQVYCMSVSVIPKQLDSISTSKSPCRENCSFPDTKDNVSSDLGKLKLGENSPEAVIPKTEQVYCMSVSVIPKQLDSISTSKSPRRENCSFPDTKGDVSSDLGKLKVGENSPEAVTPKTEQVYCMSVSVISSASAFKKGFPSLDSDKDLSLQRTQKEKVPDAEVEGDSSLRVNRLPALDTVHMGNEQTPHKKAVDSGRSDISDSVSLGVPYDICPVRAGNFVTLKAPLHVQNRTKRNEAKRSVEGKRINVLRSGMILLKSYISFNDQIEIVNKCRDLGLSSGGFYEPGYREGGKLHLKMMCLGKNWDPERSEYGDQRPSDGAKPPPIPYEFCQLVKGAIQASHSFLREHHKVPIVEHVLPTVSPNICIVNFYSKSGRLGLHQDKDESQESLNRGLPVVSFSIGDSAEFLYNDHRDTESAKKIILESGDVLIFGGESRGVFHGVTTIFPETSPTVLLDETNLRPGRLNLTFREY